MTVLEPFSYIQEVPDFDFPLLFFFCQYVEPRSGNFVSLEDNRVVGKHKGKNPDYRKHTPVQIQIWKTKNGL